MDSIESIDNIEEVISDADFLVNFLPHTVETVSFHNIEKFNKMKPTSIFINLGRRSSIVEEDLYSCLKNKSLAGASLDVFQIEPLNQESPLYTLDNCFTSCHSADITNQVFDQMKDLLVKNIDKYVEKWDIPLSS